MKIDAQKFFDEVRQMRAAQRTYFKTRDRAVLIESKRLEGIVDKMIEEENGETLF